MFDLDYLTNSMNYEPISVENQANKSVGLKEANKSAGTQANDDQSANSKEIDLHEEHFVLPIWSAYSTTVKSLRDKIEKNTGFKTCEKPVSQVEQVFLEELDKLKRQEKEANDVAESLRKEATYDIKNASSSSTNLINTASTLLSIAGPSRAFNDGDLSYPDPSKDALLDDTLMPYLEDIYASPSEGIFTDSSYDDEGMVTEFNDLETNVSVSPTPTTRIHTIHPQTQILKDPKLAVWTRSKVNKNFKAHALHWKMKVGLMLCKRNSAVLNQKVWILVDSPFGKKAIKTKWVYKNKKDERGVIVRNKARLVAQGHRQEEGIDYNEVFALVARIEAIRIFLAFTSYMGFIVYQMDVKSAFLYGTIDKKVYVSQPPGFVDPKFPNKVYKVVKALYGLHQAPRAWYATWSTFLEKSGYRRGVIDNTLFIKKEKKDIMLVKKTEDGIFISRDKYVAEILKKFDFFSVKTGSTPIETQKPLVKDEEAADVDVHLYRKSTIEGCQFLSWRLISWQCKKQTIVATSTTENPVFHSKTKHIEIRHYFTRDAYEKKLIQVLKIHTDDNVADLLAFDVSSKKLASPKQTTLGKDISNPLMAGRLPKTTLPTSHGLYKDVDLHEFIHV
nr:hypothetical protein [Tanacetum cinerariifolium]